MEIGEIIKDSFKYSISDFKKLLILGLMLVLAFLILPAVLAGGYHLRIIKYSQAGVDELPAFDDGGKCL